MFEIDVNTIKSKVKTPFGEAELTCIKDGDNIVISLIHPIIKKDFIVPKEDTKNALEDLIKWIAD